MDEELRAKVEAKLENPDATPFDPSDFYKLVVEPDFPDEMLFNIKAVNPENSGTFSREAINAVVDEIDVFLMGRTFGQWKKTGDPPREVEIEVSLKWKVHDRKELNNGDLPWVELDYDDEGLTLADGNSRIPRSSRLT